jgi:hypothetical protein
LGRSSPRETRSEATRIDNFPEEKDVRVVFREERGVVDVRVPILEATDGERRAMRRPSRTADSFDLVKIKAPRGLLDTEEISNTPFSIETDFSTVESSSEEESSSEASSPEVEEPSDEDNEEDAR